MTPQKIEELADKLRRTLANGKVVAVVGWRNSYHDDFTRSLLAEQVIFIGSTMPPANTYLILLSEVLDKTIRGKIKSQRGGVHGTDLKASEIKMVLATCKDILKAPPAQTRTVQKTSPPASTTPPPSSLGGEEVLLELMTRPRKELTAMQEFIAAFLAEAAANNGFVGRRVLGKLIGKYGAQSPALLIKGKWIVGKTADGKKRIGSYSAGETMLKESKKVETLPDDPIARVRALISRKDEITAERDATNARVAELDGQLNAIKEAEILLAKLGQLVKK